MMIRSFCLLIALTIPISVWAWDLPDDIAVLKKTAAASKNPIAKRATAIAAWKLAREAAEASEYTAAKDLSTLAVSMARPTRDPILIQRAIAQLSRHTDLAKQWKEVEQAKKELKAVPNDPAANEVVGRFQCLTLQSWTEGLPALAAARDTDLANAARADLKTTETGESQAATAANWWDLASKSKKDRESLLTRCAHWYEQAIPSLSGLPKLEAESRLQSCRDVMYGYNFKKILGDPPNGVQSIGVVDCTDNVVGLKIAPGFDLRASWLISFQINAPEFPEGPHVVFSLADGRVAKDAIVIGFNEAMWGCGLDDCLQDQRQGIQAPFTTEKTGQWIDFKLVHDAVESKIGIYIDGKLRTEQALLVSPICDKVMPATLGGIDGSGQRYIGKVRGFWLGNFK